MVSVWPTHVDVSPPQLTSGDSVRGEHNAHHGERGSQSVFPKETHHLESGVLSAPPEGQELARTTSLQDLCGGFGKINREVRSKLQFGTEEHHFRTDVARLCRVVQVVISGANQSVHLPYLVDSVV